MYHVTASKQIKPCSCTSCRAKHGRFDTLAEAEAKLAEVTGQPTLDLKPEDPLIQGFKRVQIPKTDIVRDPITSEVEIDLEKLDEIEANEFFEDEIEEIIHADEVVEPQRKLKVHPLLAEDEDFLSGDDGVIEVGPEAALVQQMENVVSWSLENFYDEDGSTRSRYSLRSNPPIFRIEASDGSSAEFVLSKNLTQSLAETFETVNRGYYGVGPRKKGMLTQEEAATKSEEWLAWAREHPIKTVFLALILTLCVITAFTF